MPAEVSRTKKGFTLLEMIIVIFLISLITGLSALFFANSLPSGRFNAAVREVAAVIRYARSLASANGETHAVKIDLDSKQYGIEGRSNKNIPSDINIKLIDPAAGEIHKGVYHIVFHATGGVAGATIVLWDEKRSAAIQMDPVAGTVVVR